MEEIGGGFEDGKNSDPKVQGLALCPVRGESGVHVHVPDDGKSNVVLPCTALVEVFILL
jgi:hypothetical protein